MARGLKTTADLARAVETLQRRNRDVRAELREIRDLVLGAVEPAPANFRYTVIEPPPQHAPGVIRAQPLPTHDSTAAPPPAAASSGAPAPAGLFLRSTRKPDNALRSFVKWVTRT